MKTGSAIDRILAKSDGRKGRDGDGDGKLDEKRSHGAAVAAGAAAAVAGAAGAVVAARKGKLGGKAQIFTGKAQSLAEGLKVGVTGKGALSGTRRAAHRGFSDAGAMPNGPTGRGLAATYGKQFDRGLKAGAKARSAVVGAASGAKASPAAATTYGAASPDLREKAEAVRSILLGKADDSHPINHGDNMDVEIESMLGALNKSVLSILDADGSEDREYLLAKSLDQFAGAVNGYIGAVANTVADQAYDAGLNADLTKFADEEGGLAKGMNHVAGFALVLRQAEYFIESWANEVEEEAAEGEAHAQEMAGGTTAEPPKGLIAAAQWYQLGREVLKIMVANATGDDQLEEGDEPGAADAEGADGDEGGAPAEGGNRTEAPAQEAPAKETAPAEGESAKEPPAEGDGEGDEKKKPFGKADAEGDLAKADAVLAKFDALQAELADLKKSAARAAELEQEIALLKAQPAPAKGAVMAVTKAADSTVLGKSDDAEADLQKQAERLSKMSEADRALELIKMAQVVSPAVRGL